MNIFALAGLIFFAPIALADVAFNIDVESPYARAAIKQQRNSAVFMQLKNLDDRTASVVSASSPVSDAVELHTHINDNGVMRMRKIPRIELPGSQTVELKPGGLHVMLLGLREDLQIGQQVEVTLRFNDGSEKKLEAPVQRVMPPGAMHKKQGAMMGH